LGADPFDVHILDSIDGAAIGRMTPRFGRGCLKVTTWRQEGALRAAHARRAAPMLDTERMTDRPYAELEAGLEEIRRSPTDDGALRLIVRRPAVEQRELMEIAQLDTDQGLVGDSWRARGSKRTVDGSADPEAQLTLMNARVATLLAGSPDGWSAAGDQLYVDLDLSESNLPTGMLLVIGEAVLEVSATPHTGCAKFSGRFGLDALRFVSTPEGRELRLRGMNTRVVQSGAIRMGDPVRKA
jgi:MOSC domain-containing protein